MYTKTSENMEQQPSAPPSPKSERRFDENSLGSIASEDRATLGSDSNTVPSPTTDNAVKSPSTDNANMPKLTLFPVRQDSIGNLEPATSKSMEVLKLASVGNVEKSALANLTSPRRRRFIISLESRTKPVEIVQDNLSVETSPDTDIPTRRESQKADPVYRRRRSAWGAQSIAATATTMTRRNKWLTTRTKRKLVTSVLEQYQQRIEDKFGSCVACFFEFVRNLLAMNVFLMIVWLFFVVLPQAIFFDYGSIKGTLYFVDIIKFRGVIGETWLFFGNFEAEVSGYHMWFAYFVCILFTFYFSLFWLITGIVITLQDEGGHVVLDNYNFSYLTFTSWDYSLRNVEATDVLCLGIANSFRDLISDVELNRLVQAMRAIDKTKLYLRRAVAWIITVVLISVGCAIIFSVITADTVELFKNWGFDWATRDHLVVAYFPSAVFSIVNLVIPSAIYQLPKFEYYIQPQLEVYLTIFRVFLLNVADMVLLFLSLKLKISWERYTGCGGTLIGQEVFKLIIIDTVIMFGTAFIVYLGYYLIFKFKKREFFMPAIVLKVIQEQTIIWIGTLACPLMPVFGCLFLLLTFFTYYYVICRFCSPTSKRWLQPHRNIFFLMMTVVALIILTITFVVINLIDGSFLLSKLVSLTDVNRTGTRHANQTWCGPLNLNNNFTPVQDFIGQVKSENAIVGKILDVLCSPVFILSMAFVAISVIYLLVCRVKWEIEKRLVLLAEVYLERLQNKKFHLIARDKTRHIDK